MSRILRAYLRVLEKHPWKTQAISTGVLMGTGDAIAQLAVERCPLNKYDPVRSGRYLIFGMFGFGPILRSWYLVLERVCGPTTGVKRLLCKVGMDQLLFAPTIIPVVVGTMTYSESRSLQYTSEKLRKDYWGILTTNWKIWPAAQLINFYYIPFQHRIMFAQFVALFWNTYLAWKIATPPQDDQENQDKL